MIAHEIYGDILPLLFRDASRKVSVVTTAVRELLEDSGHVHVDLAGWQKMRRGIW